MPIVGNGGASRNTAGAFHALGACSVYAAPIDAIDPIPVAKVPIKRLAAAIRDGCATQRDWREAVRAVREAADKDERTQRKKLLPYATPHGVFSRRGNDHLIEASGAVYIDFDGVGPAADFRNELAKVDGCAYAWRSASGNGVHALFAVRPYHDKESFNAAHSAVLARLDESGFQGFADKGAKGLARAMYLSHDPDLATGNGDPVAWTPPSHPPTSGSPVTGATGQDKRKSGFVRSQLDLIRQAPIGERNTVTAKVAYTLGGVPGADVEEVVRVAREHAPDDADAMERTARRQFAEGAVKPMRPPTHALQSEGADGLAHHKTFADEFARRANGLVRFDFETGRFFWRFHEGLWREERFDIGSTQHTAMRAVFDDVLADAPAKVVSRWQQANHYTGALRTFASAPGVAVHPSKTFDKSEHMIGLPGGAVLDLAARRTRRGEPDDYVSRTIGVAPNPNQEPTAWFKFLDEALALFGEQREGVIAWLRWWLRDALHGRASKQERMLFLQGKAGTGKSTLAGTVAHIFGGYAATLTGERMLEGNQQHRQWLLPLRFARLAVATELSKGTWKAELINALVSGEPIEANPMRGNSVTFTPNTHLLIAGNERPRSANPGFFRRLCLVEMQQSPANKDPDLKARLKHESPGILAWILGADDPEPPRPRKMIMDTDAYRASADVVTMWLDERTEQAQHHTDRVKALYDDYKAWCDNAGERALGTRAFGSKLSELGYPSEHARGGNVRVGVRLKANAENRVAGGGVDGATQPQV